MTSPQALSPKFAQVAALMDSNQPGERANAFDIASGMLTAAGLKWRDVVKAPSVIDDTLAALKREQEHRSGMAAAYAARAQADAAWAKERAKRARQSFRKEAHRAEARTVDHRYQANMLLDFYGDNPNAPLTIWDREFLRRIAVSEQITERQTDVLGKIIGEVESWEDGVKA